MNIKQFTFNPVMVNTYVIHDDSREAIIIDAGCFYDREKLQLKKYIDDNRLIVKRLINTHLHFDHQFGNRFVAETYGVMPEAHPADEFLLEKVKAKAIIYGFPISEDAQPLAGYLQEGDIIRAGNMVLDCIFVPGHAPGHLVFYAKNENVLFAGDVLFRGSIGRTDLERSDHAALIQGIQSKLMILPDETVVYPGHGPATTIGEEKVHNPYL
jgi:glyoxylase-like metal-dependent hydrolase (beta-lactamase superfamily II)